MGNRRRRRNCVTDKKPDLRRKRADGVRTITDLKDRCRIDDITGCWNWTLAISDNGQVGSSRTPRTSLPAGVIGRVKKASISAPRVAWLLSGRYLADCDGVWRNCLNDACIAPAHLNAGTKSQEGAWMSASGHRKGDPRRAAINLRNATTAQAVSADVVRAIEVQLAAGERLRKVAAQFGLHVATICKISCGKHVRQRQGVRGSSVFNLGSAP